MQKDRNLKKCHMSAKKMILIKTDISSIPGIRPLESMWIFYVYERHLETVWLESLKHCVSFCLYICCFFERTIGLGWLFFNKKVLHINCSKAWERTL